MVKSRIINSVDLITGGFNQLADEWAQTSPYGLSNIQAYSNFRSTLAEAIADFDVGEYFTCIDTAIVLLEGGTNTEGLRRSCIRTDEEPFYLHLGVGADQPSKADIDRLSVRQPGNIYCSNYISIFDAQTALENANLESLVIDKRSEILTEDIVFDREVIFSGPVDIDCNGHTMTFSKGFTASDYHQVFRAEDSSLINLPHHQRLTPMHFGARGNYVSPSSPGSDDSDALNAWASKICNRVMPSALYGVTEPIMWNGDSSIGSLASQRGLRAEPGARIVQRTNNVPILCCYGDRGEWSFPHLSYASTQDTTNYSSVAFLVTPYPGRTGFYLNKISMFRVNSGANTGFFNPPGFSSVLAADSLSGATSITVADAQTDVRGTHPWLPGMFVQIELDSSEWHISRISSVAGTVLGLHTPLPSASSSTNTVVVSGSMISSNTQTPIGSARFSNTWDVVNIDSPQRYGWVDRGVGTQDWIANAYINIPGPDDITTPPVTLVNAIWCQSRDGDKWGVINVEHVGATGDLMFISGSGASHIGHVHIEGCRLYSDQTGLIAGSSPRMTADQVQIMYCTMLGDEITTGSGVFRPIATTIDDTSIQNNRGRWSIGTLHIKKNIITPGKGRLIVTPSNCNIEVEIENWIYDRDGGIYPSSVLLNSPSSQGAIVRIGGLTPFDCVGYAIDIDLTTTNYQTIVTAPGGQYKVDSIVAMRATRSMTTAAGGVYSDQSATLVTASGAQSLSALTGSGTALDLTLDAAEATKLRTGGTALYFKASATQGLGVAKIGTSSYITGRNGGSNNTNLCFINFSTAHGFKVGQVVIITGSVHTDLNAHKYKIVDVPISTQIVVYFDSANSTGNASTPVADASISVALVPTINVFVRGATYASDLAQ